MAEYKFIHWRSDKGLNETGERFATIQIICDSETDVFDKMAAEIHNTSPQQSLSTRYEMMLRELRKTFPRSVDKEIRRGKVTAPEHWNGCAVIIWGAYIPEGEYEDWVQCTGAPVDHCPPTEMDYIVV